MNIYKRKAEFGRINGWFIYLLFYLPLCLLPAVKYSVPYVIAGSFAMLPLIIVTLSNTRYRTIFILLVALGALQGAIVALLGNAPMTEVVNEPIRSIRYFVPCVLLEKVFDLDKNKQKAIWIFTTLLIAVVIVRTLYALENDPMVARLLAQGTIEDETLMSYRFQNVGGFGNCYSLALTVAVWAYFMFKQSKTIKILSTAVTIFIMYFALKVQYMTMLLLCIAAFLIVFLYCSKNKYAKICSVAVVVFILFFMSSILRWIASLGVDSTIYIKLTEFADTLDGVNSLGDTTSRTGLYKDALLAFLSSPIFGTTNNANAHSTILSIAASSGMIGLFAYFYGVKQMYSTTKINLQKQKIDVKIFNIVFSLFIALSVVNPIHYVYEISVVLLFYIPLTLNVLKNKTISDKTIDIVC